MTTSIRIQSKTGTCPECQGQVQLLGRPMIGEVFGCGSCGAQLEVANTDPLTLEPMARVEDEEEDLR